MIILRYAVIVLCLLGVGVRTAGADQWTELHPATSPTARAGHTMVTINGVIYLFGGYKSATGLTGGLGQAPERPIGALSGPDPANGPVNDFWKFDGQTWIKIADNAPPAARYLHTAIVYNNKMYVYGGMSNATTYLNDMWSYSTDNNSWQEIPQTGAVTPSARANHSAIVTEDGNMLVYGGKTTGGVQTDAYAWAFNLATQAWTRKSASPYGGLDCHSAAMTGDKMYVFGGNSGSAKSNNAYTYDPVQDTWVRVTTQGTPPAARAFAAMTTEGASFWIFGGEGSSVTAFNDGWEFNTTTRTWTRHSDMVTTATRARVAVVTNHIRASSNARPGAAASAPSTFVLFGGLDATGAYLNRTFRFVTSTGNACAATYSSSLLLSIPILTFNGASYWVSLQNVGNSRFVVSGNGAVADTSVYSGCAPATLSADWQLHIPAIDYDGVSYRADFQYDGAAFTLTSVAANETAAGSTATTALPAPGTRR